jgi:hypothetical protein
MGMAANKLEARKTKTNFTFWQWLGFLDGAALTCGWKYRIVEQTGDECWRDYYDDGYTPLEALTEDCRHAL